MGPPGGPPDRIQELLHLRAGGTALLFRTGSYQEFYIGPRGAMGPLGARRVRKKKTPENPGKIIGEARWTLFENVQKVVRAAPGRVREVFCLPRNSSKTSRGHVRKSPKKVGKCPKQVGKIILGQWPMANGQWRLVEKVYFSGFS